MKKLFTMTLLFAAAILAAAFFLPKPSMQDSHSETLIALNEIERLAAAGNAEAAAERTAALSETLRGEHPVQSADARTAVLCGICLLGLGAMAGYCSLEILRPFHKLTAFAEEIADGNLDLPLDYERTNYFGKFTWAFDRMRQEITAARSREQAAIENNKTVIASLSHDIKTPVASLRAYAEAMEMGMALSGTVQQEYLGTMLKKCDEITKLTDDMLLHALSDMGSLQKEPQPLELGSFIERTIAELCARDVTFEKPLYALPVHADPGRLTQVLENLIHNARKYAGTDITITCRRTAAYAHVRVQDTGGGIPDEDLPFVCDRFYRGRNTGAAPGSGLGLYIVSYIIRQSGGTLDLQNQDGGLAVSFSLPLVES